MSTDSTAHAVKSREERWKDEARFFDAWAQKWGDDGLPIDPLALQRYTRPVLRRRFNKEFRFRVMGDLRGKTLLDVGCGDGLNAVMLAKMGANVTGIDVSPKAIELARRRGEVNGVTDRLSLVAAPLETADLPPDTFDLVWADGILHHVLDDLELVLDRLARWVKPGGLLVFAEPVNLFHAMRRLRFMIPVKTEATPDERPLVRSEVELIRRYVPDLRMRHYGLFGRLDQFILVNFNYEKSPPLRRAIVNGIDLVDYGLLSLPGVNRLGSSCVMYGHPAKGIGAVAQEQKTA
jgi:2-polyprenyl-3-methyl-5-hydroxy-6-metoxy-1,4-benzoquinol methylase